MAIKIAHGVCVPDDSLLPTTALVDIEGLLKRDSQRNCPQLLHTGQFHGINEISGESVNPVSF